MSNIKTKDGKIRKPKIAKGGTFGFEEKEKKKICDSIADVVGFVKGVKVNVQFNSWGNFGVFEGNSTDNKSYTINVEKSANRSSKTFMEDSVAHVLFPSAKKTFEEKKGEIISFGADKDVSKLGQLADNVFDSLEKARVKSCMSVPYKGYADRATESNKKDGELIKAIDDPVKAIYAAQLGLDELVKDSQFPEAIDYVKAMERTGNKATVIATNEYMQQVIKPWYEFVEDEQKDSPSPQGEEQGEEQGEDDGEQQGQGQGQGEGEGQGEDKPKWADDPVSDAQKRYIKKLGGDPEQPDTKGEASDMISKILSGDPIKPKEKKEDDKVGKAVMANMDDHSNQIGNGCNPHIDENETVEDQKGEGEQEIEEVENKIDEFLNQDQPMQQQTGLTQPDIEHKIGKTVDAKLTDYNLSDVEINMGVVNQLKPLFKRLRSKQISEEDTTGTDVDVDLYIKNRIEGGTDFLMTPKEERGFAVVIGVDESGSMGGGNIDQARTLCATLYKSFEDMPNVDIYVFGWTTGYGGVNIKKIQKLKDVGRLQATGGTPFLESTYYCANFIEKLPHKKKLFFQITDGDVYHDNTLIKYFEKLRKSSVEITGIQIGYSQSKSMMDLFGKKNYIHTQSMYGANSTITRSIVQKFARCIQ